MPAPTASPEGGTVVEAVGKQFSRIGPWVLRELDLVLAPGTITEVAGGNGSGKSTLLRVVAGLTRPTAGIVRGRPASVGYAPERLPARLRMTPRSYIAHMARLRGVGATAGLAVLDRLELAPGPDVPIATLSKGNSQKVALAQALAAPVGLLLLDEPTSGLDARAREALGDLLAERRAAGAAVLVTTHALVPGAAADARFELRAGRLGSATAVATAVAMVRIELAGRGDGRRKVLDVPPGESDDVLAAALAEGWSVVSVTRP
jgi:ABC-2 type transport system ATP-binding protein